MAGMATAHEKASEQPGEYRLLGSEFPGDDGGCPPVVRAALAAHAESPEDELRYLTAVAALAGHRVLVPVVAVLGEVEHDDQGRAFDKSSDMATVLMTGADGRQALLAFTCMETLQAWQADARPVPVSAANAAKAALQDDADALVVDIAGPVRLVVQGDLLRAVAAGTL